MSLFEAYPPDLVKKHQDGSKPHTFWREDLGQCHNPQAGCWCCVCSGFMCGCACHKPVKQEAVGATIV